MALNSRISHAIYDDMGLLFIYLLYRSDLHKFFRGKILSRFMSLCVDIHICLTKKPVSLADKCNDNVWTKLSFCDIFEPLYVLNVDAKKKSEND
jgi:hypothetical protein